MQIQLQAFSRRPMSLRKAITDDLTSREHEVLHVEAKKSIDRKPGWAKISGRRLPGAINLEWDGNTHMLTARAIAKRGNKPHKLLAVFLEYLIQRHGKKIASINIQLR
jgi:hypothetical protein